MAYMLHSISKLCLELIFTGVFKYFRYHSSVLCTYVTLCRLYEEEMKTTVNILILVCPKSMSGPPQNNHF